MAKKQDKCAKCIWRQEGNLPYRCDYASKTGKTRKAQPAEECTYFETGEKKVSPLKSAENLYPGRKGDKYDWERGFQLHREGMTDPQIAKELGCSDSAVLCWRKRCGLKANAHRGWTKGKARERA